MNRLLLRLVAPLTLVVAACDVSAPAPLHGDISGTWRGRQNNGRVTVEWLTHQAADGTVEIRFLRCFNGDALSRERQTGVAQLVDGHWDIQLDSTRYEDLRTGEVYDGDGFDHTYEFSEISDDRLRYRSDETGTRYSMTRASADAELACPPASIVVDSDPGERRARDAWITRGVASKDADEAAIEPADSATAD